MKTAEVVVGMQVSNNNSDSYLCKPCVKGRMTQLPHKHQIKRGEWKLDLIHTDLGFWHGEPGWNEARLWLTILDDFTQWTEVIPLQHKSEAFAALTTWIERYTTPERYCRRIHLDQGGEFTTNDLERWLQHHGIELEFTSTEQHQSNGSVEVLHRILTDRLLPTMQHKRIPNKYWPDILESICYIRNRSWIARIESTPYELWEGVMPNVAHIRTLGSKAWVLNNKRDVRRSTIPYARAGLLLGFKGNSLYKVVFPGLTRKPEWRKDVVVDERDEPDEKLKRRAEDNPQST
jgi:transposase InsO family protein